MDAPEPTSAIAKALGQDWMHLHPLLRKHYGVSPGSNQTRLMVGTLSHIDHSLIATLFLLPARIFGALIPYRGINIPTTVRNWTTSSDQRAMFWHRRLQFPDGKQATFCLAYGPCGRRRDY